MKKTIAIAALVLAGFAAPSFSVQAASMASAPKDGCLVAPLLRAECREMIREKVAAHKRPMLWWTCEPAPAGSKYMFVCD